VELKADPINEIFLKKEELYLNLVELKVLEFFSGRKRDNLLYLNLVELKVNYRDYGGIVKTSYI